MIMELLLVLLMFQLTNGCTHFRIKAKDDSVVIGRSMEFNINLLEYFKSEPKKTQHKMDLLLELCQGKKGVWESKYDILNALVLDAGVGGMNSEGLSVESLYLQESMYENVTESDCANAIAAVQLPNYILGKFSFKVKTILLSLKVKY